MLSIRMKQPKKHWLNWKLVRGKKFDDVAALMADLHEAASLRPHDHKNVSSGHCDLMTFPTV